VGDAVTGVAFEFEVVDVGRAVVFPFVGMMGFASINRSGAVVAASIPGDERDPLFAAGESGAASQPERLTVAVEDVADDFGGRPELEEDLVGDGGAVDEGALARVELMDKVDHVTRVWFAGPAHCLCGEEFGEGISGPLVGGAFVVGLAVPPTVGSPQCVDPFAECGDDVGAGDWVEFGVDVDHAVAGGPVPHGSFASLPPVAIFFGGLLFAGVSPLS